MRPQPPIIIALDTDTPAQALSLVHSLGPRAHAYKIGLQLFTTAGPSLIRDLLAAAKFIFLDLKLHEIPNSVAGAVHAAGALGISMLTVHASAGAAALQAAVRAAKDHPALQILAVTVITSLSDDDLREIGIPTSAADQVLRLAQLADRAGCHGVVASPREASLLCSTIRPTMSIVTPGIRLADNAAPDDQTRIATPQAALRAGATHLVIGRPITAAPDPRAAFEAILADLAIADTTAIPPQNKPE